MTQRRRRITKPAPTETMSGVMPLGNNYNGIPFALDLATGAVEPAAPAGADGAALRSRLLSFGEVTVEKLVEILCTGGYRAWRDEDTSIVLTPIGQVRLRIFRTREILLLSWLGSFRDGEATEEKQALVSKLNTTALAARYYADEDWLTAEYDIALSCGITGPQLLLATRNLVQNVEATLRRHDAYDLLD